MTLENYFKLSSYGLVATSIVMLAATGQLGVFSLATFAVAFFLAALTDWGRLSLATPYLAVVSHRLQGLWHGNGARRWLILLLVPLWALDKYWLNTPSHLITLHLLLAWIALRLLRFKRNKDWLWLYVASFLAVLLAASIMLDAVFFVLLVIYLLVGISTLVSFEIRRAQDEWQRQHAQAAFVTYWRQSSGSQRLNLRTPRWYNISIFAGLSLLLIAALATPLFLAMPRVPQWNRGGRNGEEGMSGFSETVRLGEVARLKLNRRRVMRVRVTWPRNTMPQQLYWRGVALDYYDGGVWLSTTDRPTAVPEEPGGGFYVSERPNANPPFTYQQFLLDPINTNVIFAAPRAIWVSGPDRLRRDENLSLTTNHYSFHRFRYEVQSDTTLPRADALRADQALTYSYDVRSRYLQVPPQLDERIKRLAREVAGNAQSNYDIAMRLVEHLQNTYQYSLDLNVVEEGDPLSDFLFNTKAGHCEYFASALTIMLRTRGIPARIVNGFQMGEYNERQGLYLVRQSDAHSWVEAYFPKHGWVTFDPTPAAGLNQYDVAWEGLFGWLQGLGDSLQNFWQERVIEFDSYEQFSLLMDLQRTLSRWRHDAGSQWLNWQLKMADWFKSQPTQTPSQNPEPTQSPDWTQWLNLRTLSVAALLLAIAVIIWWRKYTHTWRYRFRRDAAGSAIAFYEEMLTQLARIGFRRQTQQTPREFARLVNKPNVTELTQLYQQARFSNAALSAQQIDRIGVLLRGLKMKGEK